MTTGTGSEPVDVLSVDEAHALFEQRSTEWMGLRRLAFLEACERGDFNDGTDEKPVRDLIALLPFALAESDVLSRAPDRAAGCGAIS
jgi:hypothetical protein